MTSTLLAPAFVAKGHYYDLSEVVEGSKCEIVDQDDQPIASSQDADDTYLGLEKMSGVCLIAAERIFYNFQVWNDRLFTLEENDNGYGKFIPLLFVKRESKWTDAQVNSAMGALVTGMRVKWALFGIFLGIGVILLAFSIYCLYRYCQLKKTMSTDVEEQLVDPALMQTSEDELREFSGESPKVKANARPFNMGGKPLNAPALTPSKDGESPRGMLDQPPVNGTSENSGL